MHPFPGEDWVNWQILQGCHSYGLESIQTFPFPFLDSKIIIAVYQAIKNILDCFLKTILSFLL